MNNFTVSVGCIPRTHRVIGVIACLPALGLLVVRDRGLWGRKITPYKVVKE